MDSVLEGVQEEVRGREQEEAKFENPTGDSIADFPWATDIYIDSDLHALIPLHIEVRLLDGMVTELRRAQKAFARYLREVRQQHGIGYSELSDASGVATYRIREIEEMKANASPRTAVLLIEGLKALIKEQKAVKRKAALDYLQDRILGAVGAVAPRTTDPGMVATPEWIRPEGSSEPGGEGQ